jgi:nicotinate-nucleotide adenylyltransferase
MSGAAIGLLGGTFDPVHVGHLRLAIEIMEAFALGEVRLVPAGSPNLRRPPVVGARARAEMLKAAVRCLRGLSVDEREINRSGVTYTIDTLLAWRAEFGERPVALILGMDAFLSLPRWHRWRELLDHAHLIVATRPDAEQPAEPALVELLECAGARDKSLLTAKPAGCVFTHAIPMLPIAATDIRERIRAGRSIHCLVPDAVHDIIMERGYYRE